MPFRSLSDNAPQLDHAQETIELEGSVRSLTRRLITVANPLGRDKPITFPRGSPTGAGGVAVGESEVKHAHKPPTKCENKEENSFG